MSKKNLLSATLLMACFTANSGQISGSLKVKVHVRSTCSIHDVRDINFPTIDGKFNGIEIAEGSFDLTCSHGHHYSVHVDSGQNDDGWTARMSDGSGDYIRYLLFKDASLTTSWLKPESGVGTSSHHHHKIYGFIPPGQDHVPTGHYSDLVTINVTF